MDRLLLIAAVLTVGCKDDKPQHPLATPPVSTAPTGSTASPAELERVFDTLDINDDDQLDGNEVTSCNCAVADADGNTEVTKAEYLAAGLVGKFRPTATPAQVAAEPVAPAPAPTPPAPSPSTPSSGGVPPGVYKCAGSVGGTYMSTGRVVILDGNTYAVGTDGSGKGTYEFFPDTKMIVFTSGANADRSAVSNARLVSPTHIVMRTGRNGSYLWNCKR
jgi:hypothetical protein